MEIPAKWRQFGVLLNISVNTLDAVERQYDRDQEACFVKVYSIWKSEEPSPFTWETVVDTLNDMNERRLAKNITGPVVCSITETSV